MVHASFSSLFTLLLSDQLSSSSTNMSCSASASARSSSQQRRNSALSVLSSESLASLLFFVLRLACSRTCLSTPDGLHLLTPLSQLLNIVLRFCAGSSSLLKLSQEVRGLHMICESLLNDIHLSCWLPLSDILTKD